MAQEELVEVKLVLPRHVLQTTYDYFMEDEDCIPTSDRCQDYLELVLEDLINPLLAVAEGLGMTVNDEPEEDDDEPEEDGDE